MFDTNIKFGWNKLPALETTNWLSFKQKNKINII